MLRTTQDVLELRRWAEAHDARPCREAGSGRPVLSLPHETCAEEVGWDEFEPTFVTQRCVFVYDDSPGALRCFIGAEDEARTFVCGRPDPGAAAAPL